MASLINLVTDICQRNNITELKWKADKSLIGQVDKQNMTVHRWFAAKACPGDYLYGAHGQIAAEVNKRLSGGASAKPATEDNVKPFEPFRFPSVPLLYVCCGYKTGTRYSAVILLLSVAKLLLFFHFRTKHCISPCFPSSIHPRWQHRVSWP